LKGWLPLGKVSIFEGDSDVGKIDGNAELGVVRLQRLAMACDRDQRQNADLATRSGWRGAGRGVEDANDDTVVPRG
jgi:hypothetical protein